jgi:hypothetical protein
VPNWGKNNCFGIEVEIQMNLGTNEFFVCLLVLDYLWECY